ncbi:MAG: cyclic nucleotide-binding domain-containing protein [Thermodesulfobacteriota bacterium]
MNVTSDLSGNISFIGFADILQLLGSVAAEGVLKVTDDFGITAEVFLKSGEVINATYKDIKGEDAFFVPFSWEKGFFSFTEQKITSEHLISNNLTGLILEGLRLLDEGRLDSFSNKPDQGKAVPLLRGRLVDYGEIVDEEFFEKDELIVNEGRYGSWIWVLLDGLVQIEKKSSGKNIPVVQLGRGSFIGSLAGFARGDRPRSATVRAMSPVQLGVLDAQSLSREYTSYSDLLRNYFTAVDDRLRKITNAYAGFFSQSIAPVFKSSDIKGLIREKLKDSGLGIVASGEADLYLESKGLFLNLGTIKKGSMVGELPFVEKSKDYSFFLAGTDDFSIQPFDKSILANEFSNVSENVKKMVEFAGASLSVTAYNLASRLGK